jgi:hypothetical protein
VSSAVVLVAALLLAWVVAWRLFRGLLRLAIWAAVAVLVLAALTGGRFPPHP